MADSKPVSLPAHLADLLDQMSHDMGVPRDALVSQAIFTLARFNGYVVPGKVDGLAAHGASAAPPTATSAPVATPGKPGPAVKPAPPVAAPKPVAPVGVKARPAPMPEPEPEPEEELPPEEEGNPFDEQPAEEAPPEEAPPEDELPPEEAPAEEEPPPEDEEPISEEEPAPAPKGPSLTLVLAGREPEKMQGDVMTIGRGKTCDLVIDSNRVSREHARITREGNDFLFEDLNSSNGTFFGPNKEKVTRRKLKDNDELTLGTEKIRFQIRR